MKGRFTGILLFLVILLVMLSVIVEAASGPTVIKKNTKLKKDIVKEGDAVIIQGNGIELDCDGYSVIGNGTGIGINSTNNGNITIKQCVVLNFTKAILLKQTDDSLVLRNNVSVVNWAGINLISSNRNLIGNNSAVSYRMGYDIDFSDNNTIIDNYAKTYGKSTTNSIAIYIRNSSNNTLLRNKAEAIDYFNTGIGIGSYSCDNKLYNNTATSEGGYGIFIDTYSHYNELVDNVAVGAAMGICIQLSESLLLQNNIGYGPDAVGLFFGTDVKHSLIKKNRGISDTFWGLFTGFNTNNTFVNNTIESNASGFYYDIYFIKGAALYIEEVTDSFFIDNDLISRNGTAIDLSLGSTGNQFYNNAIYADTFWISSDSMSGNNYLNKTHFITLDGRIVIKEATLPADANVSLSKLNINSNNAFLNSTYLSFFNKSGEVWLNSVTFADPMPIVDYENDASFSDCSDCIELSYSGGVFKYNVTHFTSYSSREKAVLQCPTDITQNSTLVYNLTSNGSCILINTSNVELDCQGHSITGDGSGIGVKIYGDNVTLRNCNVSGFSSNVQFDPVGGLIENNIFADGVIGLEVIDTIKATIRNNQFVSNGIGLELKNSKENDILDNEFVGNDIDIREDGIDKWQEKIEKRQERIRKEIEQRREHLRKHIEKQKTEIDKRKKIIESRIKKIMERIEAREFKLKEHLEKKKEQWGNK